MLGCAEVETASKQICNLIDPNNKCGTIAEYKTSVRWVIVVLLIMTVSSA